MATYFEKIEANAAEILSIASGRPPIEHLSRYRLFLKLENHRSKLLHRAGMSGRETCSARALVVDLVLRTAWKHLEFLFKSLGASEGTLTAIVAIGDYGRSELNPFSAIHFIFLHDGRRYRGGNRQIDYSALDAVVARLSELGLNLQFSIGNVEDMINNASNDINWKTLLVDCRLVIGNEKLFNSFKSTFLKKCVDRCENEYIAARLKQQSENHLKFGNSPSMQEPNIKEGCGGLRDYQSLVWMSFFKYRTPTISHLQQDDFISEAERKQLDSAYDFLLKVLNELHHHTGRVQDCLTKSLQPVIAINLGFADRSPSRRVEELMRQVYTHARNIYLINRTLEQRFAITPPPRRLKFLGGLVGRRRSRSEDQVVDGFRFIEGYIHASQRRVFRDQPRRLMRVYLHAQQRGLTLHPDLTQLLKNQLSLADRAFLYDEHVRETFLTILNQRGEVAHVLRQMHETGLLGKYIPDFGRITCLVQSEQLSQYTLDEHALRCIETLDELWKGKTSNNNPYHPLFQELENPYLLYLTALLQDVDVPNRRHNDVTTIRDSVLKIGTRLQFNGEAVHFLRILLENRLQMANIAKHRDLTDPAVIHNFAINVQSPQILNALTIFSYVVSSVATKDSLDHDKQTLLFKLRTKTMSMLETVGDDVSKPPQLFKREEVFTKLPLGIAIEEVDTHLDGLSERYLQVNTSSDVVADITLSRRLLKEPQAAGTPHCPFIIEWLYSNDWGSVTCRLCMHSRPDCLENIVGAFEAVGHRIEKVNVFVRSDGIFFGAFTASARTNGAAMSEQASRDLNAMLAQVLRGDLNLSVLFRRKRRDTAQDPSNNETHIAPFVYFDDDLFKTYTVLDVEAKEQPGFLYSIIQTLSTLGICISFMLVRSGEKSLFASVYITETDEKHGFEPSRKREIIRAIRSALVPMEGASSESSVPGSGKMRRAVIIARVIDQLDAVSIMEVAGIADKLRWAAEPAIALAKEFATTVPRFDRAANYVAQSIVTEDPYRQSEVIRRALEELDGLQRAVFLESGWLSAQLLIRAKEWQGLVIARQRHLEQCHSKAIRRIPNPFVFGQPVLEKDSGVFTGRREIVNQIEQCVLGSVSPPTLLLHGPRRVGKTSIVKQLPRLLGPDFASAEVDFLNAAVRENPASLLRYLSIALSTALHRRRVSVEPLTPDSLEGGAFYAFDRWLVNLERDLPKGMRVLLCLDEYERLQGTIDAGWGSDFLDTLRHTIQQREFIVMMFVGVHTFAELGPAWTDRFISTRRVRVTFLSQSEVYPLLTKPLPEFDLVYTTGALEAIMAATNGQPYLTQAVAFELVQHMNDGLRKEATVSDVQVAITRALESGGEYFAYIWNEAGESGRRLLRAIAVNDSTAEISTRNKWLHEHDILNSENKFTVPIVERWVKEYGVRE